MLCDGKPLEVSHYPDLFAVLGYLYGGENHKFNIPDYRGIFLRGVDSGANNDPDILDRTDPADPQKKKKNDGVGSRQKDALQTHQHEYARLSETTGGTGNQPAMLVDGVKTLTSEPKTPALTSTETRPKNVYVHYIIKYIKG